MKHTSNKVNVLYHCVSPKTQYDNVSYNTKNRLSEFLPVGNLFYVCDVDRKEVIEMVFLLLQMVIQTK